MTAQRRKTYYRLEVQICTENARWKLVRFIIVYFCLCTAAYCTFLAFDGSIVRGFVAWRHSNRAISLLCSLRSLCSRLPGGLLRQRTGTGACRLFVLFLFRFVVTFQLMVFIFRILSHFPAADWRTWHDLWWAFIDCPICLLFGGLHKTLVRVHHFCCDWKYFITFLRILYNRLLF